MMLQDRGGTRVEYLAAERPALHRAASKRPELAGVVTVFRPDVPQLFAEVDADKVYKLGVNERDVYTTLQALLGGAYVNHFNRFGRIWKVFLQAEPRVPREARGHRQLLRAQPGRGRWFRSRRWSRRDVRRSRVHEPLQPLPRGRGASGIPAPGYSSGQAMAAVEEVAKEVLPADMGYAWTNMSYQEANAGSGAGDVFALSLVFVFLILAALYESWSLPLSVLLTTPIAVFGAFLGHLDARPREQRVRADRADHADRPGRRRTRS